MGFIRFLPLRSSTTSTRYNPWSTGNAAVGTENGSKSWVPLDTTVQDVALRVTTAVTGTQRYDVEFQTALTLDGSTVQLTSATGAGVAVTGTLGATLSAIVDSSNTSPQRHHANILKQNTPPNQDTRACWEYTVPSEDDLSWYGYGDDTSGVTLDGSNRFCAFEWSGTTTAQTLTESVAQIPWPSTGTFRRFMFRYNCGSDVTVAFRKNGGDAFTAVTLPAATGGLVQSSAVVSVTAGDLVNFRFVRASGAATAISWVIMAGFAGTS